MNLDPTGSGVHGERELARFAALCNKPGGRMHGPWSKVDATLQFVFSRD
jgi:hypothetical protein